MLINCCVFLGSHSDDQLDSKRTSVSEHLRTQTQPAIQPNTSLEMQQNDYLKSVSKRSRPMFSVASFHSPTVSVFVNVKVNMGNF